MRKNKINLDYWLEKSASENMFKDDDYNTYKRGWVEVDDDYSDIKEDIYIEKKKKEY